MTCGEGTLGAVRGRPQKSRERASLHHIPPPPGRTLPFSIYDHHCHRDLLRRLGVLDTRHSERAVRGRAAAQLLARVQVRPGERMEVTLGPRSPVSWAVAASRGPGKTDDASLLLQAHLGCTSFLLQLLSPSSSAPDLPSSWRMEASVYSSPVFLDISLPHLQSCSPE